MKELTIGFIAGITLSSLFHSFIFIDQEPRPQVTIDRVIPCVDRYIYLVPPDKFREIKKYGESLPSVDVKQK